MVLDPKHFDDMDDFCDFDDKLDGSSDGDLGEHGPNHPLAWRRLIIEKAVNNVKRALETKADLQASYKTGELVFDEESHKFGRVLESRPGFLNVSLLGGGKLVRQDVNHLDFIRENRHKLTLGEMAKKLFLPEVEVIALLNQLELSVEKATVIEIAKPKKDKKTVLNTKKLIVTKKLEVKAAPKEPLKLPVKTSVKLAAKKKDSVPKKKIARIKETSVSFTKLLPKGATTDPVMDPNGYIQQNFLLMSNRELAVATGLSEHTIRRKLGEWNLKRKDFLNKA